MIAPLRRARCAAMRRLQDRMLAAKDDTDASMLATPNRPVDHTPRDPSAVAE